MPEKSGPERAGRGRPAVSVVVPFLGGPDDARRLSEGLERLRLRPDDELIVADNTATGVFSASAGETRAAVVRATHERSSYHTRNVGADQATRDWLLFIDSDTRPVADLLDAYLQAPIRAEVGAVVGPMLPLRRGDGLVARYAESRSQDQQRWHVTNPYRRFGATANLLVRRAAFFDVGGFLERVRSGGDADFCWRLQDAGWEIDFNERARLQHLLREDLRSYLRLHARYASGRRWVMRRWPQSDMGPKLGRLARILAAIPYWWLRGQFERGVFRAIDALVVSSEGVGYLFGNEPPAAARAREGQGEGVELAVMVDRFPEPSETFVASEAAALARAGRSVRIEARSRPRRPAFGAIWGLDVRYAEDGGLLRQAQAWLWLVCRHPLRCAGDLFARRRWRREEEVSTLRVLAATAQRMKRDRVDHMHVHFARRSALDAMRISHLIGIPYSVTAHAWDIFKQPRNLREKLEGAAFVTTGCDYNVRHLRSLLAEPASSRVHRIVMGVDPQMFSRTRPYDGDRTVIAVGRLLEKKGFDHLVRAAAKLKDTGSLRRLMVVGDGHERDRLQKEIDRLGLDEVVELAGMKRHEEVRELMEGAAVLAMPSVVASDGDRDSMPVVVKEALALGLPVVASREVGLPEVVQDEWGRLVPPGDDEALAGALRELLELPAAERARMGERGRAFVLERFSLDAEAAKLLELIDSSRASSGVPIRSPSPPTHPTE